MNKTRLVRLAAVSLCGAGLAVGPVAAQSKLPWRDANPVENLSGGGRAKAGSQRARAIPAAGAPAPAAPPVDAVPVPDTRPDQPEEGKAGTSEPVKPDVPDPASVTEPALPEARPAPTLEPAVEVPAAKADGEPGEAKSSAGSPAAGATPAPDGSEVEDEPVSEIPVPELRPAEPEPSPQGSEIKPAPESGIPKPDPSQPAPDDAPNSPDKLKSRTTAITPESSVLAAAAVRDAELCEAELSRRGVEFTIGESISEGECGVLRPVNVTRLSSGIKVLPRTQLLCRSALALDDWMTNSVVAAARADLSSEKLAEFRHASTYVCRPRASESGISEHARGSAIDIASFVFASGKEIGVAAQAPGSPEEKFQADVRSGACGPFKTVLGPGTDPDHATHFHLDIAARRNGSTYCK